MARYPGQADPPRLGAQLIDLDLCVTGYRRSGYRGVRGQESYLADASAQMNADASQMPIGWRERARALGEFGATITFADSFPGQTETMPIAVYYALETDPDAAIALSLVLLLVSVVVLVSLRAHWLRGGSVS